MNITQSQGVVKKILGIETAPHLKGKMTTQLIMGSVLFALLPALMVQVYFFGYGILWQFLICEITALICEIIVAMLRHRSISTAVGDLSATVTAMILAFTLPPLLQCYYTVVATVFAIIVVKSVFGGLGHNIFNPAMAGFIFIVISCPAAMSNAWIVPAPAAYTQATLSATQQVIFKKADPVNLRNLVEGLNLSENTHDEDNDLSISSIVDSFSGATYLENIKSARKTSSLDLLPGHDFTLGNYKAYMALAVAYCIGGLIIFAFKIIILRMVVAFFASFIFFQWILNHFFPGNYLNVEDGLLFGGTMLAAFFIITDPVTNAGTSKGRIYFSVFVAFLIVILRAYGSYSDAVAFAVLLGNACAPLIDVMTSRRPYGVGYKKGGFQ